MRRFFQFFQKLIWFFLICILLYFIFSQCQTYLDKQQCLCSILSTQRTTRPIDSHLMQIYSITPESPSRFAVIRTMCDHRQILELTIYPAEGVYVGRILSK